MHKRKFMVNNSDLDPYIFLTISESCHRIISTTNSWNNKTWCEYITKHLDANLNTTHITNKLLPVFNDLKSVYSLTLSESVSYILRYFIGGEWKKYLPLIVENNKYYGLEMY